MTYALPNYFPIIHEIQTAFDKHPTVDVRDVFLDISKAFDKVWQNALLLKLKSKANYYRY